MGATIWIQQEDRDGDDLPPDLSILCRHMNALDRACKKAGVKRWIEFQDNSEMAAEFGEDIPPLLSNPAELILTIETSQKAMDSGILNLDKATLDRLEEELSCAREVTEACYGSGKRVRVTLVP
jgi:hypothetical protein